MGGGEGGKSRGGKGRRRGADRTLARSTGSSVAGSVASWDREVRRARAFVCLRTTGWILDTTGGVLENSLNETFLSLTPSVPQYNVYYFSKKSNFSKFDQIYRQKYQCLEYQIIITRFIMNYTFTFYIFSIINLYIFCCKVGQT